MLQAIKKTLAYASIFEYPLTVEEIHHWMIAKKASLMEVKTEIKKNKIIVGKNEDRRKKDKVSKRKWAIAKKISKFLIKIPSVLSILVTGNLSMNNSSIDDDIDLLIITKKNTIWTTRFFANLITDLLKVRRHPKDITYKDKICLNMFLDESHLEIKDKNIYTAHELLQAKSIFDKNNTYQKFLSKNSWARAYLPNAYPNINKLSDDETNFNIYLKTAFKISEPLLSLLQKQYMAKKITREKILPGQLLFHPKNTQREILKKFNEKP